MSDPALQHVATLAVQLLIALRYDGSCLHGTALQPGVATAAGLVMQRVRRHVAPQRIWALSVTARLDAGVHADANLVSVRIAILPHEQSLLRTRLDLVEADCTDVLSGVAICHVPGRLSARGLACQKHYRYVVGDAMAARGAPAPWPSHDMWRVAPALSASLMRDAARLFEGTYDYAAYAASPKRRKASAAPHHKTVHRLIVTHAATTPWGGAVWHIDCDASGLLRRQMRFMTAAIVCAGAGLVSCAALGRRLDAAMPPLPRAPQAPAGGLYLLGLDVRGPWEGLAQKLVARLAAQCLQKSASP